jgi:hypothetical protein
VRISTTARSAAWLTAEYDNQMSGSTFLTVAAQEVAVTANPFTIATDQVHSGTYSLKAATNIGGDDWLVANGLSTETGLRIDGYWRASNPTTLGASMGVRAGSTSTANAYELNHSNAGGWSVGKNVAGTYTSFSSVAEGSCLAANTWTKISMLVQSNLVRAYCNTSTGLVPAASWYTDAGSTFASGSATIMNHALVAGQNWWVDDVTVRRLVDAEPVVAMAPRTFADPLDDWTIVNSHDANLSFTTTNPDLHDNDSSRATRSTTSSVNIIWYRPGITGYRMVIDHWVSETVTNPTFAYSVDGSSWGAIAGAPLNLGGASWLRYEYRWIGLPAGTNYIRITLNGTAGQIWAQQLSRAEFYY